MSVQENSINATYRGLENQSRGNGTTYAEQRITGLENVIEQLKHEELYMFQYDIATVKNKDCPNPSSLLWHFGFRMTLSVWVMPQSSIDHPVIQGLMAHWSEYEVTQYVIPYAERATSQIRKIAEIKLAEQIMEQHTSFIERLGSANDRLEAAIKALEECEATATADDYEKIEAKRCNEIRLVIKSSIDKLNAAVDCARLFDDGGKTADLFAGLKALIASETLSFNAEMASNNGKRAVTDPSIKNPKTMSLWHNETLTRWDFTPLPNGKEVCVIETKRRGLPSRRDHEIGIARQIWTRLLKEGFVKI